MMEDEINFVMIDKVEGTEQEQEEGMSETQRRQLTLEEVSNYNNHDFIYYIVFFQTRRSLPIFPFRESLLQAVKDHQVQLIHIVVVWIM